MSVETIKENFINWLNGVPQIPLNAIERRKQAFFFGSTHLSFVCQTQTVLSQHNFEVNSAKSYTCTHPCTFTLVQITYQQEVQVQGTALSVRELVIY